MITRITINNFKKLEQISFPLSQSVVIIGPNNSGKSTIFQALCLWEIGVTNFIYAKKVNKLNKNGALTLNRQSLLNSPIANMRFLWKDQKVAFNSGGKKIDLKLEISLEGNTGGKDWVCKTEFTYYNEESFSCRVISGLNEITEIYEKQEGVHFGFLQPMSGISSIEDKFEQGAIDRRLGEGRTAEVLRNICYKVLYPEIAKKDSVNTEEKWRKLTLAIKSMFGAALQKPEYIKVTGTIQLEYIENNIRYDISSGGRGFQQTLLLLSYMYANPNTILLLDEPDAHLEVIRQREAFQLVNQVANEMNSQIIIASHSEVVLDEAAEASKVIALIENKVFELNESSSPQKIRYIKKALTEIGWEKYYLARIRKHVLYLEGSTDLQMLQHLAIKLKHKVEPLLKVANVQYTADNVPGTAINNFASLQEIFPQLKGLALFDNLPNLQENPKLKVICWTRRELENYFAKPDILYLFAKLLGDKYTAIGSAKLVETMEQTVKDSTVPLYLKDLSHDWWHKAKLSDDWLDVIFPEFYKRIGLPQDFYKRDYYQLIMLMKPEHIDKEVLEKLDIIHKILT
ncbi:MAG: AAA family ATPase [Bacteroidales bacterium]|nr:MAG: AAA family ATPase [Bacteroidales bacterium]